MINLSDYVPILILIGLSFALSIALMAVSFIRGKRRGDPAKLAPYECGFDPFSPSPVAARAPFDARFYLVAILFIIFDLEVAFLFPFAMSLSGIGAFGFFSMMFFITVLTVGFIYEWRKGALEWQ